MRKPEGWPRTILAGLAIGVLLAAIGNWVVTDGPVGRRSGRLRSWITENRERFGADAHLHSYWLLWRVHLSGHVQDEATLSNLVDAVRSECGDWVVISIRATNAPDAEPSQDPYVRPSPTSFNARPMRSSER